ncbi:unnamed protein product [Sphagnum jensenii]|uniref:Phytocyanin domain-containing protein n=1 Tax=Sphagnum jensenii TaxID=128206 RepID=A0ABP0VPC8_9BRYO
MVQGRGNAVVAWNVAGRLMLLAVVAVALVQYAQGATTHDVGGADEWVAPPGTTNTVNSSYLSDWASTQTFALGDSLFFEYTVGSHDVLEVTNASYTVCNTTNPIHMWTAGNTTVPLNSTGTLYFICGFPGHCLAGQKVAITVTSGSPSPPSSTTPPPSPNGSTISSLPASAAAVVFGALFVACGSLFW